MEKVRRESSTEPGDDEEEEAGGVRTGDSLDTAKCSLRLSGSDYRSGFVRRITAKSLTMAICLQLSLSEELCVPLTSRFCTFYFKFISNKYDWCPRENSHVSANVYKKKN